MRINCKSICAAMAVALYALQLRAGNENWMASVPDNTFVSQLSIPGSHDAGTGHGVNNYMVFVSGSKYAITQEKTLTDQWNSGIRAFDLRPAVDNSRLRIYHGIISTNLYMDNALTTLCGLLDSHPTETCIVIVRHESEADSNSSEWAAKMKSLLSSAPTNTHAINFDPMAKLGDVRGKLIILSRDNYDTNPVGGYVTGWGFNPNFANQQGGKITGVGTQGPLYVQDYYDVSASGAPDTKKASIQRMLQFSTSENTNPGLWVINQTSGYSKTADILGNTAATSDGYRDNAQTQNPAAATYINSHPGSTGIIMMDFAGEDASGSYQVKGQTLTNAIVANNSKAGPHADYFRALGAINPGSKYYVTTIYNGTKYYLTTTGQLTDVESKGGLFTFSRVEGAVYHFGFNLLNSYFTNPSQIGGNVVFNSGRIRTDSSSKRSDWEAQVFFLNTDGKYAVRATNANGTGNWVAATNTFWTVNDGSSGPVAEYSSEKNYIWNVEEPSPIVNVTFNIYFGGKKVKEIIAACERNSTSALPDEYINDFCSYTYSPKTITGTSVRVTVKWATSAPFKISTLGGTMNWYNLKVGRLQRYVGMEDREPYHPHAYDDASVEQYPETELYATPLVRASDAYQWAFVGNPVEGFNIINKQMGEDYSLTVDGTAPSVQGIENIKNTVLREGDFRWTAHANNNGFSLSLNDHDNFFVNTHGGPHGFLQVWETANAKTDLGSQIIAEAVPDATVPMTQIGDGYYSTLCLPYDVTVNGANAYILEKWDEAEADDIRLPISTYLVSGDIALAPALKDIDENCLLLTKVEENVPAGTPVLLRSETGNVTLSYGDGFAIQPSTSTALTGLYLPANPTSALTLQAQDDVPVFSSFLDETIMPNSAYLMPNNPVAQTFTLRFSDIEDGIRSIDGSSSGGNLYYNLAGQRIGSLQRGVNIHNGIKIIK